MDKKAFTHFERRKKVCIVTSLYPLPENIGTRMRTMNFVRFFKTIGGVDLVYFIPGSKEINNVDIFKKEYCILPRDKDNNILRKRSTVWIKDTKERLIRFLNRRPYIFTEWSSKSIKDFIAVIMKGKYHLILCRHINNTYPLFKLPEELKKNVIIDFDDIYSDSYFDMNEKLLKGPYLRFKWDIQKNFIINYQKKCLGFGAALFCSKKDLDIICENMKKDNTYVVPNTHPILNKKNEYFGNGFSNREIFLFIGALNYEPNVYGLKWFIQTIFPHLKNRNEKIRMLVVGRHPVEEIKELCLGTPDIELHADVPDVMPFYKRSGIVIVPILTGGGTRIKILEAAMAGRPVFSTPFGAYGLDVIDGKDLMLFKDKNSFSEKYVKISEKATYENMVNNLKSVVEEKYSQEGFSDTMGTIINNILGEK
jgi:glycosyltransferase involved in cell wall biosynthesis